jgi:fluoroquinolone transport system ATP-binding protein
MRSATVSPAGSGAMIAVLGLRFCYPGASEPALRGLDFEIRPGEIFGFLGPSGAGKSTTQAVLTGNLTGFSGSVRIMGSELSAHGRELYERIGVSFEFPNVYSRLTARENLAFFGSLYRSPATEPAELLDMVGLADRADTRVSELSKGMKMRLNLCRAFLNDPEVLFLDEPTSGQDPANARRIKDLLRQQRTRGRTVFLTTHDMTVASELCDRVAFIVDGRLSATGSPRALMIEHGSRVVRVETRPRGDPGAPLRSRDFELDGLGDRDGLAELLRESRVVTIHSQEATLEDVFLAVTGRRLETP